MALLMLVSVAALSSCGNKKAIPNFDIPEGGYDGSEVTITFYHTMGSNLSDVLNLYIEEFNKLYPNIHIQHEQVGHGQGGDRQQHPLQLSARQPPRWPAE